MDNMWQVVQHGVIWGLVLSAILTVIVAGSLRVNPEIWLDDYPPDIRQKFGPIGDRAKKQRRWVFGLTLLCVAGVTVAAIVQLKGVTGGEPLFLAVFLSTFTMFSVFNLFDLLVIDWLWLIIVRPSFIVLPGTEGMAGYRDYGFPFRGFLIGMAGLFVASLVISAISISIYALFP